MGGLKDDFNFNLVLAFVFVFVFYLVELFLNPAIFSSGWLFYTIVLFVIAFFVIKKVFKLKGNNLSKKAKEVSIQKAEERETVIERQNDRTIYSEPLGDYVDKDNYYRETSKPYTAEIKPSVFASIQKDEPIPYLAPPIIRPDEPAQTTKPIPKTIISTKDEPEFTPIGSDKPRERVDYDEYMHSSKWYAKSRQKVKDANYTCEDCGKRGRHIIFEAHHLTYANLGHEEMEDLLCLCQHCHNLREFDKKSTKVQ